MNNKVKQPYLCAETILFIDELCPERSARKSDSIEDIWMQAGKRELINSLLQKLKIQEDTRSDMAEIERGHLKDVPFRPQSEQPKTSPSTKSTTSTSPAGGRS